MSRELYRDELPVVVSSRPGLPSAHASPTPLSAALTLSPTAALSFTLSDLRDRLFVVSFDLSAADYPAVRDEQALRVDFAAFPHRVADLLRRATSDPAFTALLVLPDLDATLAAGAAAPMAPMPADPARTPTPSFSILETNNFKVLPHLHLAVQRASDAVVRRALCDHAKACEAAASAAESRADAAESRADAAEATAAALRPDAADAPALRARADELEARLHDAEAELARLRPAARDAAPLRAELDTARAHLRAADAAREKVQAADADRSRELDAARDKLRAVEADAQAAALAVKRLEEALAVARRNARVTDAVLERQERAVEDTERRCAALERDLRRSRDKAAMLEVERDGLTARLAAAKDKIEEAEAVHASNQQVIAYLNRELNDRAICRQQPARQAAARRGRRVRGDVFNPANAAGVFGVDMDSDRAESSSGLTAPATLSSSTRDSSGPAGRPGEPASAVRPLAEVGLGAAVPSNQAVS